MSSIIFGFFINSWAFPMASPIPAPPPPAPFLSMSAIPPMPPIPPIPPPPPNGLAPPPPPPSGCCCCCELGGLGPEASSVRTSTLLYSAYPSSAFLPTPSTRASANAVTKSVFSKKDFVDIPKPSNSFLISPAFMARQFSNSSARRSSRGFVVSSSSSSIDDDDDDRLFFFFLVFDVDGDSGVRPSALAFSNAFTSSDFSTNDTVEIP
mmetsp:Transcript_35993/g.40166  ORF Transcript_35993/g.40166 Transcript_35993/m.40166 type:complete len:208 (-) Transcript_35993:330-953(-)